MTRLVPPCLTIGSSDSSGGAGIQGDIKAFASVGCYAATVVVGVTAQNTRGVRARWSVPVDAVTDQLDAVTEDMEIGAVKVGTTWSTELLAALGPYLRRFAERAVPVVFDPVMVTAAGSELTAADDVIATIREHILPHCVLVTPNKREAELLAGPASAARSQRELASAIAGMGAAAVVVTAGREDLGDWLYDGREHTELVHPRYLNDAEHGVGCAHSTMIAGLLAHGRTLPEAVREAGERASLSVAHAHTRVGSGQHPVNVLRIGESDPMERV
jgi:hydroxymethylpyrimidine/phosphomethylpyrimidine kinase